MFGIRWWLTRPRQAVREKRLRQNLCPRCASPRTVPVLYGPFEPDTLAAMLADHPDAFVLGGCLAKSRADPGPDRSCQRCRHRFYSLQAAEFYSRQAAEHLAEWGDLEKHSLAVLGSLAASGWETPPMVHKDGDSRDW